MPTRNFEVLLNPAALRATLLRVALYVLAYETFRDNAISHVRGLFWRGVDQTGHKYDETSYREAILSRNKSPLWASLDWYREMGAIDDADLQTIRRLADVRNRLVHDLGNLVGTGDLDRSLLTFPDLLAVFRKVEVWRVINIDMAGDERFEGQDIDEQTVVPGSLFMMQILLDVALGKDEQAYSYYNDFVAQAQHKDATGPAT